MISRSFIAVLFLIFFINCGYYEKSKDYVKESEIIKTNPIKESSKKDSLTRARNNVKESKKEYQDCLKRNSNEETACESYREKYESDTEEYIKIQQQ
ncbi:MAG: hypothetical protein GTO02_09590 [Candidatus Dadabacteria bacterium]|nr:hypothetical protein [Candidatus Dadabacteria bacterium]NIQ14631.1 hypothetical protein [Candidatus Dadabacteria bacterium]